MERRSALAVGLSSIVVALIACGSDSGSTGAGGASAASGAGGTLDIASSTGAGTTDSTSATTNASSGPSATSSSTGGGMSKATINLVFSGTCAPDFSGKVVVATNADSIAVSTAQQPFSSIQLALHEMSGSIDLSTAQRVATGDVVNVITDTTWTNVSTMMPDTIKGKIQINKYDQTNGIIDLKFSGVVLENVLDHSLCNVDGTLVTTGKDF